MSQGHARSRLSNLLKAREELQDHRFSGARSFRDQNGEEVTYASDREIAAALAALDREIATLSGAARTPSTFVFRTSKGL